MHELASIPNILRYTLVQSYKRTPNIFYASSKSKNQLMYFSISINKPRLCRGSKSYFISFQNDVYVLHERSPSKGTIISKIHTFFYNI